MTGISVRRRPAPACFALLPALPLAAAEKPLAAAEKPAEPLRIEAEMLDGTNYSLARREDGIMPACSRWRCWSGWWRHC